MPMKAEAQTAPRKQARRVRQNEMNPPIVAQPKPFTRSIEKSRSRIVKVGDFYRAEVRCGWWIFKWWSPLSSLRFGHPPCLVPERYESAEDARAACHRYWENQKPFEERTFEEF